MPGTGPTRRCLDMLPLMGNTAVLEKQRQMILTQYVERSSVARLVSSHCRRETPSASVRLLQSSVRLSWIQFDLLSWAAMLIDAKDDHTLG